MSSSKNPKKARRYTEQEIDRVVDAYLGGVSLREITRMYGPHSSRIYKWLKDRGVESKRGPAERALHYAWKGGRQTTSSGYVAIRVDSDHPLYEAMASRRGVIMEHRLVMAEHLGRPLLPHPLETVHHKNGVKSDNRIGNLELMVGNHHFGIKLYCGNCGSQNILRGG